MIIPIRYFIEKTNEDYEEYNKQWNNSNRIIFIQHQLSKSEQLDFLIHDIQNNNTKDILAIRFPNKNILKNNIVEKILSGDGIQYNNGIWFPSEIWIYN
jgi:hypothetical protein